MNNPASFVVFSCIYEHIRRLKTGGKCTVKCDVYTSRECNSRMQRNDELALEKAEIYFIKSLFWNLKKLDKTNFDLRELPYLGSNEIFSNVGSLIMKNGLRPLIVYRLS